MNINIADRDAVKTYMGKYYVVMPSTIDWKYRDDIRKALMFRIMQCDNCQKDYQYRDEYLYPILFKTIPLIQPDKYGEIQIVTDNHTCYLGRDHDLINHILPTLNKKDIFAIIFIPTLSVSKKVRYNRIHKLRKSIVIIRDGVTPQEIEMIKFIIENDLDETTDYNYKLINHSSSFVPPILYDQVIINTNDIYDAIQRYNSYYDEDMKENQDPTRICPVALWMSNDALYNFEKYLVSDAN